jgi:hypothetical protein
MNFWASNFGEEALVALKGKINCVGICWLPLTESLQKRESVQQDPTRSKLRLKCANFFGEGILLCSRFLLVVSNLAHWTTNFELH